MSNFDFYNYIKFIFDHQGTVALIDINEFKKFGKEKGNFCWKKFKIGSLKAIPIQTDAFTESCRVAKDITSIRLTPNWSFLTNGKKVITPSIEVFEITERLKQHPKYTLVRKVAPNHHYFDSFSWAELFDKVNIREDNAVEWAKRGSHGLLEPVSEEILERFLDKYQNELDEFNGLYEESVQCVRELNSYQKIIK